MLVTSDFLATGGDGIFAAAGVGPERFQIEQGITIRDSLAEALGQLGGELAPGTYLPGGSSKHRFQYPGDRPVRCQP